MAIGSHDNLNEGGIPIYVDMDDLASQILSQDYGLHRLLSAIVRAARAEEAIELQKNPRAKPSMLIGVIEGALTSGISK